MSPKPGTGNAVRAVKGTLRRPDARLIPVNIRVDGVRLTDDDRVGIRRRLAEKLRKYSSSLERVTVRVRDINGPRGGIDILCRIKAVLIGGPSVVVEQQSTLLRPALTRALTGLVQAVRREVQRKRVRRLTSA